MKHFPSDTRRRLALGLTGLALAALTGLAFDPTLFAEIRPSLDADNSPEAF